MPWLHRPIAVTVVQVLDCALDGDGTAKEIRLKADDGGELRLLMPVSVAADLRESLTDGLNDADFPAFRTFRGTDS